MLRYITNIVYPFFKYKVVLEYLKSYISGTSFTFITEIAIEPNLLASLLSTLAKTTYQPLIKLNVFLSRQIEQLLI